MNQKNRTRGTSPSIQKLPFLGTTWYTRGPAYWLRRVAASSIALMALVGATLAVTGFVGAMMHSAIPFVLKVTILVAVTFGILLSFVWAFEAFFRAERDRKLGRILRPNFDAETSTSQGRRVAASSVVVAALLRAGSLIAGLFVLIGSIFCFGWLLVLFIWTLQKELGVEHDARLRLEQQRENRRDYRG